VKEREIHDELGAPPSARRRLHDDDSFAAQPPVELDRAIIAQAQRALDEPPPRARPAIWIARWTIPIGVAATILLSSMIVLQLAPIAPAPAPATMSGTVPAPATLQARDEGVTQRRLEEQSVRNDASAPPPPPPARQPGTMRSSPAAAPAPATAPAPAPAPAPAAFAKSAAPATGALAAPAAPAPAREMAAAGAVAADALATGGAGDAARTAPNDADTAELQADPARWQREIARLDREGRRDEARRERLAFRQRYPDYHP
jgi:hypothetical protein